MIPQSAAARLAIGGAILWMATRLVGMFVPTRIWGETLVIVGKLFLLLALFLFLSRMWSSLMSRFLWKIRRRLILAYIFSSVIPLILFFSIVALSAFLLYYQLMHFLLLNQVGLQTAQLESFAAAIRNSMEEMGHRAAADREGLQQLLDQEARFVQTSFATAAIYVRLKAGGGQPPHLLFSGTPDPMMEMDYRLPSWLSERDFSGIVFEPPAPQALSPTPSRRAAKAAAHSNLSLRSVAFSRGARESEISVEVIAPVDRNLLRRLKSALGLELFLLRGESEPGGEGTPGTPGEPGRAGRQALPRLLSSTQESTSDQELENKAQYFVPMTLYPVLWENGQEAENPRIDNLVAELSLSGLYRQLFLSENKLRQNIADILQFLLLFFLAAEILSLLIGAVLTKTITAAVHSLDRGVRLLKKGDFSHRIVVKSNDQLGDLADSFNTMSRSLQELMKERVEKERLDRELEIAKEVQGRLFPKCAPDLSHLDICGSCLPARSVSGDFFDYLTVSPQVLGITIGDICGKGISAALLMANLQAAIRSQAPWFIPGSGGESRRIWEEKLLSAMVEKINRHVLEYTASSKFATLFIAVIDQENRCLTYCNAGHNPPLILQGDRLLSLKTGGTVAGMFAEATFAQETIPLQPGDLFVGYTDGLVEASNEYGEEFGEERLRTVLLDYSVLPVESIHRKIMESVQNWSGGKELEDDMTLIVARCQDREAESRGPGVCEG